MPILHGELCLHYVVGEFCVNKIETEVLFRTDPQTLGYLPEGPISLGQNRISWVGIQHGQNSTFGSLNILDLEAFTNQSWLLSGRPGFAFPDRSKVSPAGLPESFIVGLERKLVSLNLGQSSSDESLLVDGVESEVSGTIINDGVEFDSGLIFGCKDLEFSTQKAGLYLFENATSKLTQLRNDQICSNGKVIESADPGRVRFLDIDTPTQKVVRYEIDLQSKSISEATVVLDLANENGFPDGMVASPDGSGVIIAFFNPADSGAGMAKCFDLKSGKATHQWSTPGSPQVTCPLIVPKGDSFQIVLTTAAENMPADKLNKNANAGCLFIGEANF